MPSSEPVRLSFYRARTVESGSGTSQYSGWHSRDFLCRRAGPHRHRSRYRRPHGFRRRAQAMIRLPPCNLDGEIRDGRHVMRVRVYYEDTDFSGIVYHANFLRFMERGRTNYLRLLGTNQHALLQEAWNDAPGFTFVVRSMTIDFLKPAVLDDELDVVTLPQEIRGASIVLLQECRCADDLLVTARVRVAF